MSKAALDLTVPGDRWRLAVTLPSGRVLLLGTPTWSRMTGLIRACADDGWTMGEPERIV